MNTKINPCPRCHHFPMIYRKDFKWVVEHYCSKLPDADIKFRPLKEECCAIDSWNWYLSEMSLTKPSNSKSKN